HPNEEKLRDDIQRLLAAPIEIEDFEVLDDAGTQRHVVIEPAATLVPREGDHPFFSREERAYPRDPSSFAKLAEKDVGLVRKMLATLEQQRAEGAGKLEGVKSFADFAGQSPFLDGHV